MLCELSRMARGRNDGESEGVLMRVREGFGATRPRAQRVLRTNLSQVTLHVFLYQQSAQSDVEKTLWRGVFVQTKAGVRAGSLDGRVLRYLPSPPLRPCRPLRHRTYSTLSWTALTSVNHGSQQESRSSTGRPYADSCARVSCAFWNSSESINSGSDLATAWGQNSDSGLT